MESLRLPDSPVQWQRAAAAVDLSVGKAQGATIDLAAELRTVQQRMEAAQQRLPGLIAEGDRLPQSLSLADLAQLTDAERLLHDARRMVAERRYPQALDLLDEFLGTEPAPAPAASSSDARRARASEQEARYLKAFCHSRLGDLVDALRALLPLRGQGLEPDLDVRVRKLREATRGALVPRTVISFLLTFPAQPRQAEAALRDMIELDHETGTYYFVLAAGLASLGNLDQASQIVSDGLVNALSDRDQLTMLAGQIRRQLVIPSLAPAVAAFKQGDYRRAAQQVRKLPADLREVQLVQDFADYLRRLVGTKAKASAVAPDLPFARCDALYFLLAAAEVQQAKSLLDSGRPGDAERVLDGALTFVPRFAYANFLYAAIVYGQFGEWLTDPARADLDRLIGRLDKAAAAARIAATDPEIAQAGELSRAVGGLLGLLREERERRRQREQEVQAINAAISEFNSIMESAQGGISREGLLAELRHRLTVLDGQVIPRLQQVAVSGPGKKAVSDLRKAVRPRLSEIAVAEAHQQLKKIIDAVKGGISSEAQLTETYQRLSSLRSDINRVDTAPLDRATRRSLRELAKAVDRHLAQLQAAVRRRYR